ncbi:RAMP1 protein, partial [Amia calva]|nr:RAMP1 protein [Amia calva]
MQERLALPLQTKMTKMLHLLLFSAVLWGWSTQTHVEEEEEFEYQERYIRVPCNENLMQEYSMMYCWEPFHMVMSELKEEAWCDWNKIIGPYNDLSNCMEKLADLLRCFFPNPTVQELFVQVHAEYFGNCTAEEEDLMDPPQAVVITLTVVPVCLIPFLVALVVWKSNIQE